MPPLSPLEELVADCYRIHDGSFEEQVARVRAWLGSEIDVRRRALVKSERVEVECRTCGAVTEVSRSYAQRLGGDRELPLCIDCQAPARTAEVEAEAVAWIRSLGGHAQELAGAVAVLR
jgi:hypothetical protein